MSSKERPSETGCILVADIAGFSRKPARLQVESVKFLSEVVDRAAPLQTLTYGRDWYVNCTGDGFVLVVRDAAAPGVLLECRSFRPSADLAMEGNPDGELQVRQGIHSGRFAFGLKTFHGHHAIGTGLNMAQRVANVGTPGQVVVSGTKGQSRKQAPAPSPGTVLAQPRSRTMTTGGTRVQEEDRRATCASSTWRFCVCPRLRRRARGGGPPVTDDERRALVQYRLRQARAQLV